VKDPELLGGSDAGLRQERSPVTGGVGATLIRFGAELCDQSAVDDDPWSLVRL
jgi:hypothetical protein